jgi:hypothetical protein
MDLDLVKILWICHHKKIDFTVEYLRKYESICKKALTPGSRAQMELFDEKPEVENLMTGPL